MAKRRRKSTLCSNCNYRFEGIDNFCPNCGQENHSHHATFKHLVLEFLEGITHFDTKFYNTARALFFSPGRLTNDYIADRRARHVPPLRLYIFVSFLFFFIVSLTSSSGDRRPAAPVGSDTPAATDGSIRINILGQNLTTDTLAFDLTGRTDVTDATIDSILNENKVNGWLGRLVLKQGIKSKLGMIPESEVTRAFLKNLGVAFFMLMPVFALLLKLFYIRKKRLYIDHLVFSVHFHTFAIALLVIGVLLLQLANGEEVTLLMVLVIIVYGGIALQKVYKNKWWLTLIKSLLLFPIYIVFIIGALIMTALISVATL